MSKLTILGGGLAAAGVVMIAVGDQNVHSPRYFNDPEQTVIKWRRIGALTVSVGGVLMLIGLTRGSK